MGFGMTQNLNNQISGAKNQLMSMAPSSPQSTMMRQDTSPYDSSGMNFGSGQPSAPVNRTGNTGIAGGNPGAPQGQPQTDGTLLGTSGSIAPPNMGREQYRDAWMGSGVSNIDQMKQWLSQNGGTLLSDNGTFRTPQGEVYDGLIGARTGHGTPGWTIPGGSAANNTMMMGPAGPGQQMGGMNGVNPAMIQSLLGLMSGQGNTQPLNNVSNGSMFMNSPQATMDVSSFL